jgi:hypothetical protein
VLSRRGYSGGLSWHTGWTLVTAVCVSIDRFLYGAAQIRCLPYDRRTGVSLAPGRRRLVYLPQAGWELGSLIRFSVCKVAGDPQLMPGIAVNFFRWSDNGDGFYSISVYSDGP